MYAHYVWTVLGTVQFSQDVYNTKYTMRNIWQKIRENKNSSNIFLLSKHLKVFANMIQTKQVITDSVKQPYHFSNFRIKTTLNQNHIFTNSRSHQVQHDSTGNNLLLFLPKSYTFITTFPSLHNYTCTHTHGDW